MVIPIHSTYNAIWKVLIIIGKLIKIDTTAINRTVKNVVVVVAVADGVGGVGGVVIIIKIIIWKDLFVIHEHLIIVLHADNIEGENIKRKEEGKQMLIFIGVFAHEKQSINGPYSYTFVNDFICNRFGTYLICCIATGDRSPRIVI